jgi:hypothetical protein
VANHLADIVLVKAENMSNEELKPEEIGKMKRVLHQLADIFKFDYESEKFIEDETNEEDKQMTEELQKQLDEALASIEALKTEKSELEALSKMSDEEKAYMDGMEHEEKSRFMAMSAEERKEMMTKKSDEVTKGMSDEAIAKMESIQKQLDDAKEALAKSEEESIAKSFIEKAEKEFPHVAGEPAAKGAFLRKADEIGGEIQEFAISLMKSAEDAGARMSQELGSQGAGADAKDKLNGLAKALSEKENISFYVAYDQVVNSPEGSALYKQYIESK